MKQSRWKFRPIEPLENNGDLGGNRGFIFFGGGERVKKNEQAQKMEVYLSGRWEMLSSAPTYTTGEYRMRGHKGEEQEIYMKY